MGLAADKGVVVWDSVSKGVGVGDGRGGAVMYVVGGSKGVSGVRVSSGDSNGRRQGKTVSGGAGGSVRGGEGKGGWRK